MRNLARLYGATLASMLMSEAQAACCTDQYEDPPAKLESPLPDISEWTARHTNFPAAKVQPRIEFHTASELARYRYGGHELTDGREVVALYDNDTATIMISEDWRHGGPVAASILVHEMVHHLQHESGRHYSCASEQEEQAFAAQDDWLAERGTSLEK